MYSKTRNRETIYGKYIMNYHPDYRNQVIQYYDRKDRFSIEGGDILNLSNRVPVSYTHLDVYKRQQSEYFQ